MASTSIGAGSSATTRARRLTPSASFSRRFSHEAWIMSIFEPAVPKPANTDLGMVVVRFQIESRISALRLSCSSWVIKPFSNNSCSFLNRSSAFGCADWLSVWRI
jgi:hypothetical protein